MSRARVAGAAPPFFEAAIAALPEARAASLAKSVANWVLRDLLQALKEREAEFDGVKMTPASLAKIVTLVGDDRLTVKNAREIFGDLVDSGADPEALALVFDGEPIPVP